MFERNKVEFKLVSHTNVHTLTAIAVIIAYYNNKCFQETIISRDGEVTKNSLSRHEHRTDINTEFRSLSIMVS